MYTVCLARSQRLHPLVARFREAGLPLAVRKRPRAGRDVQVFQFDIPRKIRGDPRSEYFRIYLGKPESRVEVVATDSNLRQVVMLVEEQQPAVRRVARHLVPRGAKVRGDVPSGLVEVETFVPGRKRHFLLGVDDRQLFVCRLPRAVSTSARPTPASSPKPSSSTRALTDIQSRSPQGIAGQSLRTVLANAK